MSKESDSKPTPPQSDNDKPSTPEATTSEKKPSHLKLVVSNPNPLPEKTLDASESAPSIAGFTAKVQKRGHLLYEMSIQDPFHDLGCDLILEIEKSRGETAVVCHFPVFLGDSNKFLDEDETLYGITVVQFQMNVLEQLFLFCADHGASQLTIYMDDAQAEGFGIYQDFLVHCDETLTEMVISTDRKAFRKWCSFMKKTNLTFEQDLWREQRLNPAIRRYLKSRAHG